MATGAVPASAISAGGVSLATITLTTQLKLTSGAPGPGEYSGVEYSGYSFDTDTNFTITDPDGILIADLSVDGEVGLAVAGQWNIWVMARATPNDGALNATPRLQLYSYSNNSDAEWGINAFSDASGVNGTGGFLYGAIALAQTVANIADETKIGFGMKIRSTVNKIDISTWKMYFQVTR